MSLESIEARIAELQRMHDAEGPALGDAAALSLALVIALVDAPELIAMLRQREAQWRSDGATTGPEEQVTPEMRARAKTIYFGMLYASPPLAPYLRGAGVGEPMPRVLWDAATSQRLREAGLGGFEVHPRWRAAMEAIVREGPAAVSATRIALGVYSLDGNGAPSSKTEPGTADPHADGLNDALNHPKRSEGIQEVPASRTCSGGRLAVLRGPLASQKHVWAMRPLYCPICGRHRTVSADLKRFLHTGSVKHRPCAKCLHTHSGLQHG